MSKQVLLMPTPPGTRGVYQVAGHTGAMSTVGQSDILLAFRWTDRTRFAVLDYLSASVGVVTEVTTDVISGLELNLVTDYNNEFLGGRSLLGASTTHENKLKSDFPVSLATSIRISETIALDLPLTAVPEVSALPISEVLFGTGPATDIGLMALPQTDLFRRDTNSFPFVISTDEGFVVRASLNSPASGTLRYSFTLRWLEIAKQVF